jgi:diguanylate cyclase (GGDEF)-like protein
MFNKKQVLGLNLICAIGYFLSAFASTLLALPPTGASPIWPSAGIALAALILFDKKILPGLFLGALFAQTFCFFDNSSSGGLINSFFIGGLISIGSCLQALLGAWLIKRYVEEHDLLCKDSQIIRFLLLGGPVACLVAASIGTATLSYTYALSWSDGVSNWLTWWLGDTIGVLIVTPLLLIFFAKPRELWQSRKDYVAYPLLMFLILVVLIFYYTKEQEQQRLRSVFEQQTSLLESSFSHELNGHIAVNEELQSFFDNSQVVTQEEFLQISKTILKRHKSIQMLTWIPKVDGQQRTRFEQGRDKPLLIHELNKRGEMVKAGQRTHYFPLTYIEPLSGNELFLGFDIATNKVAITALQKSQNTAQTTITSQLEFIPNSKNASGVLVSSPIYAKNATLKHQKDKENALQGFIASVLQLDSEVLEAKTAILELQLLVNIVEGETVLYSDFPVNPTHQLIDLGLKKESVIKVADKIWQITYFPSKEFVNKHQSWERWWLLCGCLLFATLTSMGLLMLAGRTLRTEELVKLRTDALSKEVSKREEHSRIFHALAISKPLNEVLALITKIIETDNPQICCSILLLNPDSQYLQHVVKGQLPDLYTKTVDEINIVEMSEAEATANFLNQPVDISANLHPYWQKILTLAQQANLYPGWSVPILGSNQQILGVFIIYHPKAVEINKTILERIEEYAHLASLAVEKHQAEDKIRRLAFYDTLTQLPNRRLLNDRLTQELASIERHPGYGALMFLDLDHFKTLNDSLGHHIGDELLIQVAARLRQCVRDEDTVARLGGDEFVVLQTATLNNSLQDASNHALTIAKRIQSALYIPYSLQGYEHYVTSSIGITLFGKDNKNIEALFKQADTAMYAAKAKGRNAFSFYNAQMQNHADKRLELERELIIALNSQQFKLYYHPQYNAQGKIVSAEALLRWFHPERGLIATADFISACEESGLILAVGEWALKAACQQILAWPTLQCVAVNIGPRQFQHPGFVQQITEILAESHLPPHLLMLEITEKAIIKDQNTSIEKLTALQNLGVKVTIDDFGVGYSSVGQLKDLPINQIKIDRKFIQNLNANNNSESTVIVKIMIMIAKQLGLQIAAEGVETAEQLAFLQTMECNIYQGHYFNKPLAVDEFALLLTQNE